MQQVVEGMMSVFFLMVLVFTGMGIAGALTNTSMAQEFKVEVIERLEDCDYDQEVIELCFKEAMEKGLHLTLKLYYSDGNIRTYTKIADTQRSGYIVGGTVKVGYLFEIPFLNISEYMEAVGSLS